MRANGTEPGQVGRVDRAVENRAPSGAPVRELQGTREYDMITPDFSGSQWRKSSRSNGGGNCVEMALHGRGTSAVRDSKLGGASPVLPFTADAWASFLQDIKMGIYERG